MAKTVGGRSGLRVDAPDQVAGAWGEALAGGEPERGRAIRQTLEGKAQEPLRR